MTAANLVPLHTLPPGARFRLPFAGKTGTLNLANECRANVTFDGAASTRTVTARKGEPDERTFTVPDRAAVLDITPNVMVEPLTGTRA